MKAGAGLVLGAVVGFVVGIVVFRLAAAPNDGWADLTSIAGSIFSWAPVGAVSGLAMGLRHKPWPWGLMLGLGVVLAAIPVLVVRDSTTTAWGLVPFALLIGAVFGYWLHHRSRPHAGGPNDN